MSARLLKKILKEQEATQQQNNSFSSSDESNSPKMSAPARNPFDVLVGDDDNENDTGVDQGSDLENLHQSEAQKNKGKQASETEVSAKPVSLANQKLKKGKKKKAKDELDTLSTSKDDKNYCNNMVESLSLGVEDSSMKSKISNTKKSSKLLQLDRRSILQIDPKHLRAENEMRRIFGSKVVSSFERGLQTGTSRQTHGGRRGMHSLKRTMLVTPSEHWPRWDGSLSMEYLETAGGFSYFRYVHSSSYSQAQRAFEAAKAIHDLNGIVNVLAHHPYHVDSLITLAEYFQFSGEHHRSVDAIRQCLYGLECAWHPTFTPLQNICQLKYEHDNNKQLFTALFAHMKNMDKRGCHRSALEICKLLLSLDSDDPMGALFCIDYFSLRADEYLWLEQFADEYGNENSLWLFPNFSFSLAVCRFSLERKENTKDAAERTGRASSADLMKQALLLHPSVLKMLVVKVPLKGQVWIDIVGHSLFKLEQTGIPSLDHLTRIYVERSYLIWRLPHLQKLLKDAAQTVILSLKDEGSDAKDWACVRREVFPHEKNEYRHLLLSDFSDTTASLPPDNLQQFMDDPRVRELDNGEHAMNLADEVRAPRDLSNRNELVVLFESMLPWIDYGREGDQDHQNDHHDE